MKRFVYEFATSELRKITAAPTTEKNYEWKKESLERIKKAVDMCERGFVTDYEAVMIIGNFERKVS